MEEAFHSIRQMKSERVRARLMITNNCRVLICSIEPSACTRSSRLPTAHCCKGMYDGMNDQGLYMPLDDAKIKKGCVYTRITVP